jgi:hypothetical protein
MIVPEGDILEHIKYSKEFPFLFATESGKLWLHITLCTYTSKAFANSIVFLSI